MAYFGSEEASALCYTRLDGDSGRKLGNGVAFVIITISIVGREIITICTPEQRQDGLGYEDGCVLCTQGTLILPSTARFARAIFEFGWTVGFVAETNLALRRVLDRGKIKVAPLQHTK